MLRPGAEVFRRLGGMHKFTGWNRSFLTDSGGFQVFSLAYGSVADELKSCGAKKQGGQVLKISEEGVHFRSYRDGAKVLLTPETSIAAQKAFGSDIIIPLDELPPYHIGTAQLKRSLERTHRWEKRSLEEHLKDPRGQAMYAVIHGGVDPDLRKESCDYLSSLPFDGFSIGGSLGKTRPEMIEMLSQLLPRLPVEQPNHLLGIGDLESLASCVPLGIDTFDSSYPTRAARHGLLLSAEGNLKAEQAENANYFAPIERDCTCWTCQNFSRAYLHHLFKAKEATAHTLATVHNLHFMVELMRKYRAAILEDRV